MNWLTPPAHASDTGVIQPPPEETLLMDPTGMAVPERGGCTPNIIISMEPATADHVSGGRRLRFEAPVCIMGDEAVRASLVRDAADHLTSTVGEVKAEATLPPELAARLEQAIQRVEIAASAPPPEALAVQGVGEGLVTPVVVGVLLLAAAGPLVAWATRRRGDGESRHG